MRRMVLLAGSLLLALQLFAGVASADYQPENDIHVDVLAPVNLSVAPIGNLTFQLQERVHQSLFSASGISVNHYYIWLYVNGQPVAAVDPAKAMF